MQKELTNILVHNHDKKLTIGYVDGDVPFKHLDINNIRLYEDMIVVELTDKNYDRDEE